MKGTVQERGAADLQHVVIKPKRAEWKALYIGLMILCAAIMLAPPLSLPLALALPLLVCPMVRRSGEPAAYIAALAPTLSALLAGYDPLYAASLALIGLLPLFITRFLPDQQRTGMGGILWYVGVMFASLTAVTVCATCALGAPLWKTLAEVLVRMIADHERSEQILLQAASAGLASIPDGYQSGSLLGIAMGATYKQQMLLSLRLTIEATLYNQLPGLLVQASVVIGLFTQLRLLRFKGTVLVVQAVTPSERKTTVAVPLGFQLLMLPRSARRPMLVLAVASLVLLTTYSTYAQTLGQLCFTLFEQVFTLIGAAVMIHLLCHCDPERKTACGVLAAFLYLFAPFALFLIGVMDSFLHFRTKRPGHPERP